MAAPTENPARWITPQFPTNGYYHHDDEVAWIDELERKLPESVSLLESFEQFNSSTDALARIRTEIQAATQHCHASYCENLQTLLQNIGSLRRERGVMWCGFGVTGGDDPAQAGQMPRYPEHLRKRREGMLGTLWNWLHGIPSEDAQKSGTVAGERVEWTFSTLGHPEDAKRWLAGCLCLTLQAALTPHTCGLLDVDLARYPLGDVFGREPEWAQNVSMFESLEEPARLTDDARRIRKAMDRPVDSAVCHFRFDRWVDNLIVAIGRLKYEGAHAPAEPGLSLAAWTERIAEYVRAINTWIDGEAEPRPLAGGRAPAPVIRQVCGLLGKSSPVKIWLAASLSKTMRMTNEFLLPQNIPDPRLFTSSRA